MMSFATPRPRRRVSLTPMIDVVFLLLVFFMLAARFGAESALVLSAGGGAAGWEGAPRLVEVAPNAVRLNGAVVDEGALAEALAPILPEGGAFVLRPVDGANLQRLVDLTEALEAAGAGRVLVVE